MTHLSSTWQDSSVTLMARHQTTCGSTCSRTPVPLKEPFPSTLSLEQMISTSPLLQSWTMRHKQSIRCVCILSIPYTIAVARGLGWWSSWEEKSGVEEVGKGLRERNTSSKFFVPYCTCACLPFISQYHCLMGVRMCMYILNFPYTVLYVTKVLQTIGFVNFANRPCSRKNLVTKYFVRICY